MNEDYSLTGPSVSFIIIEYNSVDALPESISGIINCLTKTSYEIIISSNSCYDKEKQESLKNKFPAAVWIFNEKNGGFAYGMNQGLRLARGRFLAILNPDAVLLDGFEGMLGFMNKHSEIGAIGPEISDSKGIIQDSCRNYVSLHRFLLRQLRRTFINYPARERGLDHSLVQTVDWIAGAFIMVSRKAFEATNGLDEKYFLYAEDMDWCARIREAGYEIVYYPEMQVRFSGTRRARRINNFTGIFIKSHLRFWNKFGYFSGYPERKEIIYD